MHSFFISSLSVIHISGNPHAPVDPSTPTTLSPLGMTSTSFPENEDPPTISCGHSDVDPFIVSLNTDTSITSCPDVQAQFPDVARDSMCIESDESTSSEGDSRESADNGDKVFFGVSYVFIAQEYNCLIPTSFLEQR